MIVNAIGEASLMLEILLAGGALVSGLVGVCLRVFARRSPFEVIASARPDRSTAWLGAATGCLLLLVLLPRI